MTGDILAIDPGNEQSAWVVYNTNSRQPTSWDIDSNGALLGLLDDALAETLAIETVQSFGMAVGQTVFDTCIWTGRFIERWQIGGRLSDALRIYRKDVKMHLCGSMRAKDANIRQALLDRYGSDRRLAVGVKAAPGPLYGMRSHCWSALAVAVTAAERGSA